MTIRKCDRCGKEIEYNDDLFLAEIIIRSGYRTCAPDLYDLCKDCKETLDAWLTANRGVKK